MKAVRWIVAVLIMLIVVVVVLYLRRDYVATTAANQILEPYAYEVQELRVESLEASSAKLSTLTIKSLSGDRFEFRDVLVVLGPSGERLRAVVADRVAIIRSPKEDGDLPVAQTLATVLELPAMFPNTLIRISSLQIDNFPLLEDIEWATPDMQHILNARSGSIHLHAETREPQEGETQINVSITGDAEDPLFLIDVAATHDDGGYSIAGVARAEIGKVVRALADIRIVPPGFPGTEATLESQVNMEIDDASTSLDQVVWQLEAAPFEFAVDVDPVGGKVIQVRNLVCASNNTCSLDAALSGQSLNWSGYDVRSTQLSLPLEFDFSEGVMLINLLPHARLLLEDVSTLDLSFGTVELSSATGAEIEIGDGWQTRIERAHATIENFSGVGDFSAKTAIDLQDLLIRDSGAMVSVDVSLAPGAEFFWGGSRLLTPTIDGMVRVDGRTLSSELTFGDKLGGISGTAELERDINTGEGTLLINDAVMEFYFSPLSSLFPDSEPPYDIVNGAWRGAITLEWISDGDEAHYAGTMTGSFEDLDAYFEEIVVSGVNSQVSASIDSRSGFAIDPADVSIELVDVGLPVENISFRSEVDLEHMSVRISDFQAEALGGELHSQPFEYSAKAGPGDILLEAKRVQLQLMLELAEFENVEVTGTVSGTLPISTSEGTMTITDGLLTSDGDGGIIRYGDEQGLANAVLENDFSLVTQYLGNFEFDSLDSVVDYSDSGDLALKTRLSGINPDVDPYQPIILNLNVENNIPQLLRSLQAIRSIEDILEERADH